MKPGASHALSSCGSKVRLHVLADQQSDKQAMKQAKKRSLAVISALLSTE